MKTAHKPRSEMITETRAKLVASARHAFGTVGYADASMDDFTAAAGLTRGALYHHFGDKKGLLQAVIAEIDAEMSERLSVVSARADNHWLGFVDECVAYIEMAVEPEIQRIVRSMVVADAERLHSRDDGQPGKAPERGADLQHRPGGRGEADQRRVAPRGAVDREFR